MKLGKIIRTHRHSQGLTQEQLAQRLGVSTPAVNKWENDNSYPDITLLPPLARALGIDLDTLFCFHDQLSAQEVMQWCEHLQELAQQDGLESAHEAAMKQVQQYPTCGLLLLRTAVLLEGLSLLYGAQPNRYQQDCLDLLERAAQDADTHVSGPAVTSLIGQYRKMGAYDRAQALLDTLPEQQMDKRHVQAGLHLDRGETDQAYSILEQHLLSATTELLLVLSNLMTAAQKENDREAEQQYLTLYEQLSRRLQPMGEWSSASMRLSAALERADREEILSCLRRLLENSRQPQNPQVLFLYRHSELKDPQRMTQWSMVFQMIRNAPEMDFLRDDPEFIRLMQLAEQE